MTNFTWRCMAGFALAVLWSGSLNASTIYTYAYTSDDYSSFLGNTFSTQNFLTVSVSFLNPLSTDMPLTNLSSSVVAWSFSDQIFTLTPANATIGGYFDFVTDSSGEITQWGLDAVAQGGNLVLGTINLPGFTVHDGSSFGADSGQVYNSPNAWQLTTSDTEAPEPTTGSYFACASLLLAGAWRRQRIIAAGRRLLSSPPSARLRVVLFDGPQKRSSTQTS